MDTSTLDRSAGGISGVTDPVKRFHRMAADQRRESQAAAIFLLVIAVITFYFFLLNAYVLFKSVPRPYQLSFEATPGSLTGAEYALNMEWKRPGQSGRKRAMAVHPDLVFDGTALGGGTPVAVSGDGLTRPHDVRIAMGSNTTAGAHEGALVATRVSGPGTLPFRLEVPVTIGVAGGIWNNWRILGIWLMVALFVTAIVYVMCLAVFPAPSGRLIFRDDEMQRRIRSQVRLRARALTWIAPWKRSTCRLADIWKEAGIRPLVRPRGEIMFVARHTPILLLNADPAHSGFSRGSTDADNTDLQCDETTGCGPGELMIGAICFCYEAGGQPPIFFAYRAPGSRDV